METNIANQSATQLPIMKYFDDAKLVEQGKTTLGKWRNGEKPIGAVVGLLLIGVAGWGLFKYVLPAIFVMLGQTIAVIASVLLVVLTIMALPVIFKLFRHIVRWFHFIGHRRRRR